MNSGENLEVLSHSALSGHLFNLIHPLLIIKKINSREAAEEDTLLLDSDLLHMRAHKCSHIQACSHKKSFKRKIQDVPFSEPSYISNLQVQSI